MRRVRDVSCRIIIHKLSVRVITRPRVCMQRLEKERKRQAGTSGKNRPPKKDRPPERERPLERDRASERDRLLEKEIDVILERILDDQRWKFAKLKYQLYFPEHVVDDSFVAIEDDVVTLGPGEHVFDYVIDAPATPPVRCKSPAAPRLIHSGSHPGGQGYSSTRVVILGGGGRGVGRATVHPSTQPARPGPRHCRGAATCPLR